jgi:lipoprotein-anchoring transpeptidase ErfK/SrfK
MTLVGIVAAARAQQADEPAAAAEPERVVAPGVNVAGVPLAGMTEAEVEAVLADLVAEPVTVTFNGSTWRYSPSTLGALPQVAPAVKTALGAPAGAALALRIEVNDRKLHRWTRAFAASFERSRKNAAIVLRRSKPEATRAQTGRTLSRPKLRLAIRRALTGNERVPIRLPARLLKPRVSFADLGPAIVIKRASNKLILYRPGRKRGMHVARTFGVATGQASYPTPLGSYTIVQKQRNPWWIPPKSDWAEGEKPVPPGPGNPLGTRWMGLSAPAVGIHGTPDAASIGYSASHGCIRMLVPQAEWVFERVDVGTPVYILDA